MTTRVMYRVAHNLEVRHKTLEAATTACAAADFVEGKT